MPVSTGGSIQGEKAIKMEIALSRGDSISAVSRAFHVTRPTVRAFLAAHFSSIDQRKNRLAAQAERIATRSAELILEQLEGPKAGKIPLNLLNPTFGVAVDKTLALRGDPSQIHEHRHVLIQDDDLIAFAVARSEKKAKARTLPAPQSNDRRPNNSREKAPAKGPGSAPPGA